VFPNAERINRGGQVSKLMIKAKRLTRGWIRVKKVVLMGSIFWYNVNCSGGEEIVVNRTCCMSVNRKLSFV
jgi:hypothetical protein